MLGPPLDVEQAPVGMPAGTQHRDQPHPRHLGGVPAEARIVEHRLTGEQPAVRDAVQAAGQPPVRRPGLHRVRAAGTVQLRIDRHDRLVDPAPVAVDRATGIQHPVKGPVDGDLVVPRALAQRAGHPQPVQRQHAAPHRGEPADPLGRRKHVGQFLGQRHREHRVDVRPHHQRGVEAHGQPDQVLVGPLVRPGQRGGIQVRAGHEAIMGDFPYGRYMGRFGLFSPSGGAPAASNAYALAFQHT